MILCITEKPSVATDIAKILGATKRCDGYFEGNNYCVTWTFGHLCTLKDPADYFPEWKRWSLSQLPMIPPRFGIKLIDDKGIKKQFDTIKNLIENCSEIINCGDAGQEGELIQRWVMQKAGNDKPVKRLWISSLTDEAIREGFEKLKPAKDLEPLYMAGLCRAIGDWILGINATRLYTIKYGVDRNILSVGRVQTPTLALIVNRQKEIENFIPQTTWELRTLYRDVTFVSSLQPFESPEKGNKLIDEIKDLPFEVTGIEVKKGTEAPPRLFDLTSLQVECNKKLSLSAEQTLRTIQSLYEKKVTTYPRVDTTYLTEDMYPKCGSILNSLKEYQPLLQSIRGKKLKKTKKVFDNSKVTDHHAIIPTGQPLPDSLTQTEKEVFDIVARRFICVFFPDCTFTQTQVHGKTGNITFKATGKQIIEYGWKVVYEKERDDSANDNDPDSTNTNASSVLPEFKKGETGKHDPFLAKRTSQPLKYYTEGTLLKAMETAGQTVDDEELRESLKANGIGRPSTRAAIIEILLKRGYIRHERKSLRATSAAFELMNVIKEDLLKSAKLTGIWEGRLRSIERGTYSAEEFINQLKLLINEITLSVLRDNSNRRISTEISQVLKKKTGTSKKSVKQNKPN